MRSRALALVIFAASGLFSQGLTGTWQGTVKNPDTKEELRTVLKITQDSSGIKGTFYSIDQTFLVFPATITLQNSTMKMSIPGIAATYEGKLGADGNTLTGTVKGFSVPTAWNMKRVSDAEAWAIPKAPQPTRPMTDPDPSFEVATIKPTNPDTTVQAGRSREGNFTAVNVSLEDMMTRVYDLHSHQIIGLPSWASSDKWDITAKPAAEGQPNADQIKIMLWKLIVNRFALKFHDEKRELPLYTLSQAKGGAKISINKEKADTGGVIFRGPGSVLLNNLTMDDFAKMLQNNAVDRPVLNQTSLAGKYTFSLVWTPEQALAAVPNPNALAAADRADVPPDLGTALQQQLGLKIDSTRQAIEVMVIDKVEKPSEN